MGDKREREQKQKLELTDEEADVILVALANDVAKSFKIVDAITLGPPTALAVKTLMATLATVKAASEVSERLLFSPTVSQRTVDIVRNTLSGEETKRFCRSVSAFRIAQENGASEAEAITAYVAAGS